MVFCTECGFNWNAHADFRFCAYCGTPLTIVSQPEGIPPDASTNPLPQPFPQPVPLPQFFPLPQLVPQPVEKPNSFPPLPQPAAKPNPIPPPLPPRRITAPLASPPPPPPRPKVYKPNVPPQEHSQSFLNAQQNPTALLRLFTDAIFSHLDTYTAPQNTKHLEVSKLTALSIMANPLNPPPSTTLYAQFFLVSDIDHVMTPSGPALTREGALKYMRLNILMNPDGALNDFNAIREALRFGGLPFVREQFPAFPDATVAAKLQTASVGAAHVGELEGAAVLQRMNANVYAAMGVGGRYCVCGRWNSEGWCPCGRAC